VGTWAFPEASFIVTFTSSDAPTQERYFHLTRYLGVEQIPTDGSSWQLTALEDAQAVYQHVIEMFRLENQGAAPGSSAMLPETLLLQIRAQAIESGAEAVQEKMKQAGLDEITARSLADTLTYPTANGVLVVLARRKMAWKIAGLGLLEGRNGLWRLRSFTRDNENWIEANPCDVAQAREEIRQVMNEVLPEPLPAL